MLSSEVTPDNRPSRLHLSAAQSGLWFAQQLDPTNHTFVTGQCIEIRGGDAHVLAAAVDVVLAESPELSAAFDNGAGGLTQRLGGRRFPATEVVRVTGPGDPLDAAIAAMKHELQTPIDPAVEIGFGARVHVLEDNRIALFLKAHHILIDVYGYGILGRRIAQVYSALRRGIEIPEARRTDLRTVVDVDRDYRDSDEFAASREFWAHELRNAPEALTLDGSGSVGAAHTARRIVSESVLVPAEVVDRLSDTPAGAGWADAVTALVAAYVGRRTGASDVILGFPSMNRLGTASARALTVAVNVLPLRIPVTRYDTSTDLADRVREAQARIRPHARYRGEDIHRDLRLPAGSAGLVGPTVNVKPFGDTLRFVDAEAVVHSLARGPVRDVSIVVRRLDRTRELEFQIDADADRYTPEQVRAHGEALADLVGVAADPDRNNAPVSAVDLRPAAVRRIMDESWAGVLSNSTDSPDVLELFDTQVRDRGAAPAVTCRGQSITYSDLATRVDAVAAELRARGAGPEVVVALALPRTVDMVVAILAVLRCGSAYLPLDPAFPRTRVEYMLDDARPRVLLTGPEGLPEVNVPGGTVTGVIVADTVEWTSPVTERRPVAVGTPRPANAAYLIYTSGSTGNPKGVVIDRRALARFVRAASDVIELGAGSSLLAVTTLSFDIAALELFVPLAAGGTVVLADESEARDPAALAQLIAAHGVTAMQATPSLWGAVIEETGGAGLDGVDVLVGGEALPGRLATDLARAAKSVRNMYGPTEATVWCTSVAVTQAIGGAVAEVTEWTGSIGVPFDGSAVRVLDGALTPVDVGVVGELYVAGPQLARGYRGRAGLTATRFVADPSTTGAGELMYRTGDLVRWRADGELEYLSRADDQVKVRGHRIELGEIETVATTAPGVAQAVAVARTGADGSARLFVYVTPAAGATPDSALTMDCLAARLPAYMVPAAVMILDEFPLTPNLKVDRKRLPAPEFDAGDTGRAPASAVELDLAARFEDVLAVSGLGVDADFFTLGGTSLSATRLITRIKADLGVNISLRNVFDAPTVAALAAIVEQARPATAERPGTPFPTRADRFEPVPLSPAQQQLWFMDRAAGPSATYNIPFALRVRGTVDVEALHRAVHFVVARHDVLRSIVVDIDGVAHQRILATGPDLVVLDTDQTQMDQVLSEIARRPFDLESEAPLRVFLVRTGPLDSVLVLLVHHIAGDEWSAGPLLTDLAAAYRDPSNGSDVDRPQYADHVLREIGTDRRQEQFADLEFWGEYLAGAPEELALPYDRPRPPTPSGRGSEVWIRLDRGDTQALRSSSRRHSVTTYMLAQAAVSVLLAKLGGGDDIVLGSPVSGRKDHDVTDMVGLFVTTIAQRVDLSGNPTMSEVLRRVRSGTLDTLAHQDVSFDQVVDHLGVTRSLARHPVFQTMVQHRSEPELPEFVGLDVSASYLQTGTAKFDLTFEFVESAEELAVRIEFAADLFDRSTIESIGNRLLGVLAQFVEPEAVTLAGLNVLTADERGELAASDHLEAPGSLLPEILTQAYREAGDDIAVLTTTGAYTYREVAERSHRLARGLRARGIGPDSVVAVATGRSTESVVLLGAVILAGAAYLPVDPKYPSARIRFMLSDAAPDLVVFDHGSRAVVGDVAGTDVAGVDVEELERQCAAESSEPRWVEIEAGNLAYVVYTSGSTGTPKGVSGTAGALANRLLWQRELTGARSGDDVRLAKSSFSFIDGSTELLAALISGARIVLADDDESRDVNALAALVREHGVTAITAVPSLASALVDVAPDAAAGIEHWFLSGEPLGGDVVQMLRRLRPGVGIVNSYGSSEVAGDVTLWAVPQQHSVPVQIGSAVPGVSARILDPVLSPVPDAVVGELYIGGVQTSRGYLGRPALTALRYVADPVGNGARVFRTGDLVRRNDATIEFVSRADTQLSLRGFRIEAGEVEAALTAHPDVAAALVAVRAVADGSDQLLAYVIAVGADTRIVTSAVQTHLRTVLPDYMIPAQLIQLDVFPTLPNGKIDRDALPAPARSSVSRAPDGPMEAELCALLGDVLGVDHVGPDEDFFALGGNSLSATRLSSLMRSRLGRQVSIREIFDLRTPAAIAAGMRDTVAARPQIVRQDLPAEIPMSAAQRRLWFLYQLEGPSSTYNVPFTMKLTGRVDSAALATALAELQRVHETLRTVFSGDRHDVVAAGGLDGVVASGGLDGVVAAGDGNIGVVGFQRVLPTDECVVPFDEIDTTPECVHEQLREAARHVFDLERDVPVRVTLFRVDTTTSYLMVLIHHIAADEWSSRPLVADLSTAYTRAVSDAAPSPIEAPAVRYRDYTVWQSGSLDGPNSDIAGQTAYWTTTLAGIPEELELPRDRLRPSVSTYRGDVVTFELAPAVVSRLRSVATELGATMFMVAHAGVALLLKASGAGDDIVIGSPVAGRSDAALERLLGFFVNTLVLRTDLSGDPSFADVLGRVRKADLDAFAHQDVPFDRLVEKLAHTRSLSRQPLFQTLVQYRDPIAKISMTGLTVEPVTVDVGAAKFDLTFDLAQTPAGAVSARIEYAVDLFDRDTVAALARRLKDLLGVVAASPTTPVSRLELLPVDERRLVEQYESGRTDPGAASSSPLPELFARQVTATPDALAVLVDETGLELTYRELGTKVDSLAALIHGACEASGSVEPVVAVSVRRSAALIVTLLAVHRAGAAYLPLDDSYPADRLAYMVADADPVLLVTSAGRPAPPIGVPVLVVDDHGVAENDGAATTLPRKSVHPDAAAYVLYTSGSTGKPKGVVVSHRSIANRIVWMQAQLGIGVGDRVLQKTPSGFDVSVWEFFWPLVTGATLVTAVPDGHRDPGYLVDVLDKRRVTLVHFVPSMLAAFLETVATQPELGRPAVARVLCSGEALTADHRDRFHDLVDGELHNLYGPTEAAVDVTHVELRQSGGGEQSSVPIGTPVWNTRTLVLNRYLQRVPIGVPGELYLGGVQLARGYFGRSALTADRFVADIEGSGGRLYRTGDLVRWRRTASGLTLDYLGRTDSQVKLRGLRIELGEIEAVLTSHPDVVSSAVVVHGSQIHACVVLADSSAAVSAVLEYASTLLPEYMVPATVAVLDEFPVTANGKLDRKALPVPRAPEPSERRAPSDPAEVAMCALFAAVLDLDDVGADDDFFMLGGDSILSMRVVGEARRAGITFGPREIFKWRTPAALAAVAEFTELLGASDDEVIPDDSPADPVVDCGPIPLPASVYRRRESGVGAPAVAAAIVLSTPGSLGVADVEGVIAELLRIHDALRLRLTTVAGTLWSLEVTEESNVVVELVGDRVDVDRAPTLDPEVAVVAARLHPGTPDEEGLLQLAIHPFAVDAWTFRVIRDDLSALLARHGSGDAPLPARPRASARGFAGRLNDRAQDPALTGQLVHWSHVVGAAHVLATGAGALGGVETRSVPVGGASTGAVESTAIAALADAIAHWRGTGSAQVILEVQRDGRLASPTDPDCTRLAGAWTAGIPVRIEVGGDAATSREVAEAALREADSLEGGADGYSLLRYLGAQTAQMMAQLPSPGVVIRVVETGVDALPADLTWLAEPSASVDVTVAVSGHTDSRSATVTVAGAQAVESTIPTAVAEAIGQRLAALAEAVVTL
ncbi:amino acid adenylation domain-containing protein [Rhodococcus sp. 27YEA15]|uniref:amino acid adenylation domain-containing protein n=1 Tax=Rhodococcus sp. 27YEA15 TaxID=3156259 RepID=UPI003C7E6A20